MLECSLTKMAEEETKTVVMPKLSTIFRRASMELTQICGGWGLRSERRACAWGAIRFYFGDNEDLRLEVQTPNTPEYMELRKQIDLFEKHLVKTYGSSIVGMNDGPMKWSFARFAEECEMLGI